MKIPVALSTAVNLLFDCSCQFNRQKYYLGQQEIGQFLCLLERLNIFSSVVSRFLFSALFVQNLSLIFNNYSLNAFTVLDIGAIMVNNLAIIELLF